VGIPGAATVLAFAGTTLVWWRHPAAVVVALVTAALAVALCLVASRAATTALAPVLSGRRSREVTGFVVLVVVAVGYLGFGRLTRAGLGVGDRVVALVGSAARVLGWTPLGAAWAAPADVAAGEWGTAGLRVAVLVASLAVLALVWDRALARALVHPDSHISAGAAGRGLGWFGRVPQGPRGAILARSLTYWRRDPRYAMAVAAVPLMPLAMWAFGLGDAVLLVLPFLGVIMGWSIASDTSSDGTAFWLHVASPVRGLDDRVGRAAAAGVVLGPVVVLLTTFLALVTGRAALLPGLLGATLGAFLTALGAASVMSALVVMRVQRAGESPFGVRQGGSLAAVLSQMGGMVVVGALALPEVGLGALSYAWSSSVLGWVGLLVGLVLGALLAVVGVRWGGHLLDRRAPVLLQRLVAVS
jgi:ABC-2 type transport system permease protein